MREYDRFKHCEEVLKSRPEIENPHQINFDEYGFSRTWEFTVRGTTYQIEVWTNLYRLHIGEMIIIFYHFDVSTTWPMYNLREALQFYNDHATDCGLCKVYETVSVIPISYFNEV